MRRSSYDHRSGNISHGIHYSTVTKYFLPGRKFVNPCPLRKSLGDRFEEAGTTTLRDTNNEDNAFQDGTMEEPLGMKDLGKRLAFRRVYKARGKNIFLSFQRESLRERSIFYKKIDGSK